MGDDFPFDLDTFLGSVVEILKLNGDAMAIGVIVASKASAFQSDYDNWNGGTAGYTLNLSLDLKVFASLTQAERETAQRRIEEAGGPFFAELDGHHLSRVRITPSAVANPNWREEANSWLKGEGINNQGRVRSDNIASRQCDGLLFRSEPEILLYRALKARGVTFAPLPVFVRGGESYARLEPDFVVLKDGIVMCVEVDGDTFHRETPAEAHDRIKPLYHEGAHVERIRASDCDTSERAGKAAAAILAALEKHKRR